MLPPGYPWVPSKKSSPFGPAVMSAIGNIYMNVLFYYIAIVAYTDMEISEVFYHQLNVGH